MELSLIQDALERALDTMYRCHQIMSLEQIVKEGSVNPMNSLGMAMQQVQHVLEVLEEGDHGKSPSDRDVLSATSQLPNWRQNTIRSMRKDALISIDPHRCTCDASIGEMHKIGCPRYLLLKK